MSRHALELLAGLSLAACGGLHNPDLGSGALAGRLQGATGAAYVYPLGRPDLVARPAADGSWSLSGVPVETAAIVVVDGAPGGWRSSLVPVTMASAALTTVPAMDAGTLPAAGRVGVVASLGAGCASAATRFTAVGTDREGVAPPSAGAAAVLEPLPAGTFAVAASASGFSPASVTVTVVSGATVAYSVPMAVDAGQASPGCSAEGASCRLPLRCEQATGVCYECLSDADCAASTNGQTTCVGHACVAPGPASGQTCDPCTADSDCATAACAAGGFCTRPCVASPDCPAGFACGSDGGRDLCLPPVGCENAKEALGSECFSGTACADELAAAACVGAQPSADPPIPGYCSGQCVPTRPDDCTLVPGYACDAASGVCVRTP